MATLQNPSLGRTRRLARFARYATVLLLLALFAATHLPSKVIPYQFSAFDKAAHCLAYVAIALAALTSLELAIGLLRPQHYFLVWLAGTLYGAFDEITQIPVGRHCDPLDWMFDILGIVIGLILFRLLRPMFFRGSPRSLQ